MDMIATTFDIAMFLSRGGDCVQGIARGVARVIIENFFYVGRPRMKVALEDDEERFEFNRRTTSGWSNSMRPRLPPSSSPARRRQERPHGRQGPTTLRPALRSWTRICPNFQTGWTGRNR